MLSLPTHLLRGPWHWGIVWLLCVFLVGPVSTASASTSTAGNGEINRVANWQQLGSSARFQYTITEPAPTSSFVVSGSDEEQQPARGELRRLAGVNAAGMPHSQSQSTGSPIIRQPIPVSVGIHLDQITEVNQRNENFGVVGYLILQWTNPAFAFNPKTCGCSVKLLTNTQFKNYVVANHLHWPEFIFFNQQGKRWSQGELFRIHPDGRVDYYERFSMTLQAPDFNFEKFPFDTQTFYIRLQCLLPEEDYRFTDLSPSTGIGTQLGEEEWYIIRHGVKVSSGPLPDQVVVSMYSFWFQARRHLSFYIFRIFVPLGLIITISWVLFFLRDYSKRIDISGANLLVFIAFNFTIGSDLPRLDYLTLMDAILVIVFVVTTLTVICNVFLERLDGAGKGALVARVDRYIRWGYPIIYIVGFSMLVLAVLR